MVKKISILIIVTAVLVTGYISVKKLNYWERTILLFKLNSSGQSFYGRGERGRGGLEGRDGYDRRPGGSDENFRRGRTSVPDSMRVRAEGRGDGPDRRMQNRTPRFSSGINTRDTAFSARGSFNGQIRDLEGRGGRGDFRGKKQINLNNVLYFLSAFAFFTVIVIYLEKAVCLITRRKQS